jgi:large subunit ribosomal protein L13
MKTYLAKKGEVERKWWLFNAEGQTLGRLASQIAKILKGKAKPEYTQNVDVGDFVIVVNAEKVKVTGKKELQKVYYRHTGFPGGFKEQSLTWIRQRHPERIIEHAVKGMLPRNTLGDKQFTKLNVYKGPAHPHKAQKPTEWNRQIRSKERD